MNKLQLPPKRWQSSDDPRYDPIRYNRWFARLGKRKQNIALLSECLRQLPVAEDEGKTIRSHCMDWCVSEREFRDYRNFIYGEPKEVSQQAQDAINHAYHQYVESNAMHAFHAHLEACAPLFALQPRQLRELWECASNFWPTGYKH